MLQITFMKILHLSGGLLMYFDDAIGLLLSSSVGIGESLISLACDYYQRLLKKRCPLMLKRGLFFGWMLLLRRCPKSRLLSSFVKIGLLTKCGRG
jgi:hypothetical protein